MTYNVNVSASGNPDATRASLSATLAGSASLADWRSALADADRQLTERFSAGEAVGDLVALRARLIDELLVHMWRQLAPDLADRVALVAVGGYGRGELLPASDIDFMLLLNDELPDRA